MTLSTRTASFLRSLPFLVVVCLSVFVPAHSQSYTQWQAYQPVLVTAAPTGLIYSYDSVSGSIIQMNSSGVEQLRFNLSAPAAVLANSPLSPVALAADQSYVYILDSANQAVLQYSASGAYVTYLDNGGSWSYVTSMSVDGSGNLYVVDSDAGSVTVLNSAGAAVSSITDSSGGSVQYVDVNSAGSVYLIDSYVVPAVQFAELYNVLKVDGLGAVQQVYNVTAPALRADEFWYWDAEAVAVDSSGNVYALVYLSDYFRNCTVSHFLCLDVGNFTTNIYKFSANGTRLLTFTSADEALVGTSLTLDEAENVLVADGTNARLVSFSPAGVELANYTNNALPLNYPSGLALDSTGNVYVPNQGSLLKISPTGSLLATWGNPTTQPYYNPGSVTLDASGLVYVYDTSNNAVVKLTSSGALVAVYNGTAASPLEYASGLAVDSSGSIYLAEVYNQQVVKLSSDGSLVSTYTTQLNQPADVVLDAQGNLLIADSASNQIVKLAQDGTLLATFNTSQPALASPQCLAIDSSGRLYICDTYNYRVVVLSSTGQTLGSFTTGPSMCPEGIELDAAGNVYITDNCNRAVVKWNTATSPPSWLAPPSSTSSTAAASSTSSPASSSTASPATAATSSPASSGSGSSQSSYTQWQAYQPVLVTAAPTGLIYSYDSVSGSIIQMNSSGVEQLRFNLSAPAAVLANSPLSPVALAADQSYVYILDSANQAVLQYSASGAYVTYLDNGGSWSYVTSMSVDGSGNLYVVDSDAGSVTVLNSAGAAVSSITDSSGGSVQYVDVNSAGSVYLIDSYVVPAVQFAELYNVLKVDGLGAVQQVYNVTAPALRADEFWYWDAEAVAVDSSGNVYALVYLSDYFRNCTVSHFLCLDVGNFTTNIYKFSANGTRLLTFTSADEALVGTSLTLDEAENVLVADGTNARLVSFSPAGVELANYTNNALPLNYPSGLALDSTGNVYVPNQGSLLKISPTGSLLATWGNPTTQPYYNPGSVTLDASGLVYVYDTSNNAVVKLTSSGALVAVYNGTAASPLEYASGLAVDSSGSIYLAEVYNQQVVKLSSDGSLVSTYTTQLNQPADVVLDAQGNLLIADSASNQIVKLAQDGTLLATFNTSQPALASPQCLAIDSSGRLYICDTYNYRVVVLSSTGQTLGSFTTGPSMCPEGIELDAAGNVYITDNCNRAVVKWNTATSPPSWLAPPSSTSSTAAASSTSSPASSSTASPATAATSSPASSGSGSSQSSYTQWQAYQPVLVTAAPTGLIYSYDSVSGSIIQMNSSGVEQLRFNLSAPAAVLANSPLSPVALAADQSYVYILDSANQAVLQYSASGAYVTYLDNGGSWSYVTSMSVDGSGNLYVVDSDAGSVTVLNSAGAAVSSITDSSGGSVQYVDVNSAGSVYLIDSYVVPAVQFAELYNVLKVDGLGAVQQVYNVTAPALRADEFWYWDAEAVAVDSSGNVYALVYLSDYFRNCTVSHFLCLDVGNFTTNIYKFSANGTRLLTFTSADEALVGTSLTLDEAENVLVADGTNARLVSFSPAGVELANYTNNALPLNYPSGLALDSTGNVYVPNQGSLLKISPTGSLLATWGNPTTQPYYNPGSVTLDASGLVYVYDTSNNAVVKLTSSGALVAVYNGTAASPLEYASGLAVDSSGSIYLAEVYNQQVVKLSSDGSLVSTYTTQLNQPADVVLDAQGNLLIADSASNQIVKLAQDGTLLATFNTSQPALASPQCLAIDSSGRLYICDTYNYRVVVLSSTGQTLGSFTTGPSMCPEGIELDAAGNVYITDNCNRAVVKWNTATSPPSWLAPPSSTSSTAAASSTSSPASSSTASPATAATSSPATAATSSTALLSTSSPAVYSTSSPASLPTPSSAASSTSSPAPSTAPTSSPTSSLAPSASSSTSYVSTVSSSAAASSSSGSDSSPSTASPASTASPGSSTSASSTTSSSSTGPAPSSSSSSGLSNGAIAGIVVGSVVGGVLLLIVCCVGMWYYAAGRKEDQEKQLSKEDASSSDTSQVRTDSRRDPEVVEMA